MDEDEALRVAADRAAVLRTWSYEALAAAFLDQRETTEIKAPSGATYGIEVAGERDGDEALRVVVTVEGGPSDGFVIHPDGTFVSEDES